MRSMSLYNISTACLIALALTAFAQSRQKTQDLKQGEAMEKALRLPAECGPCDRNTSAFFGKPWVFETYIRRSRTLVGFSSTTMKPPASLPSSSRVARFIAQYGEQPDPGSSRFNIEISFYEVPAYTDQVRYERIVGAGGAQGPAEWSEGGWTEAKLPGEAWHFGELEHATGQFEIELAANGISVKVDVMKLTPRIQVGTRVDRVTGKEKPYYRGGRRHAALTPQEASAIESLAAKTLQNALEYRRRSSQLFP